VLERGRGEGKAEEREKEKLAAHGHKMARACAGVNVAKNVSEPGRFRFHADCRYLTTQKNILRFQKINKKIM